MTNTKQIKVSSTPKPKKGYVPNIRMSGEWLRQAGFEIGSLVDIQIQPGQIVISIEEAAKGDVSHIGNFPATTS